MKLVTRAKFSSPLSRPATPFLRPAPSTRPSLLRKATDNDSSKDVTHSPKQHQQPEKMPLQSPPNPQAQAMQDQLVPVSTAAYLGMTLLGAGFAQWLLHKNILPELLFPSDALAFIPWSIPLLIAAIPFFLYEDKIAQLKEIKSAFDKDLVPALRKAGPVGLLVVAAGAGYGEEALFRGFIQPYLIDQVAQYNAETMTSTAALSPELVGIGTTALIFGSLHAMNSLYFVWATVAGVWFGYEAQQSGLGAAALTHTFYDFAAFLLILFEPQIKAFLKMDGSSSEKKL